MDIKKKAITGVKWTTLSTVANFGSQLALVVILARFLSPSDFGLMAIITVVIEFSMYFVDVGISNAIIHKQEISEVQLSTIYFLNILTGTCVFIIVSLSASMIASFYNQPVLTHLLVVTSVVFIINPIGQVHKSLLQKTFNFKTLTNIELVSRLFAFLVSVVLAFRNAGVYALVGMVVTNSIVSTLLLSMSGRKLFKPQFVFRINEIKSLLKFGYFQMGERSLNYFAGQFDTILIGKILGSSPLGIYSMGKSLTQRPGQIILPIVTKVTFPYMARLQDDNESLKNAYLTTIKYLSSINFPIYLGMMILAKPIVLLMFGERWNDAIIIVKILAMFNIITSVFSPVGTLLLAKGRTDLGFYWNVGNALITPVCIYIGSSWGIGGVAWSYLILYIIITVPFYRILIKNLLDITWWEYHRVILLPFAISVIASIIPFYLSIIIDNLIIQSVLVILSGSIFYALLTLKYNNSFFQALKQFR
jgi:O-antigen/teichoic acid export membrane protein